MKSRNIWPICLIILLGTLAGCALLPRPNPLKGWVKLGGKELPNDIQSKIKDDYTTYIKGLPHKYALEDPSPIVNVYRNPDGRIAAQIRFFINGDVKEHLLIYDSHGVRIKIKKYTSGTYMS
jgi:hypothetical protein